MFHVSQTLRADCLIFLAFFAADMMGV